MAINLISWFSFEEQILYLLKIIQCIFMLLNIVKKSMKGPVKILFGQSKIHVKY